MIELPIGNASLPIAKLPTVVSPTILELGVKLQVIVLAVIIKEAVLPNPLEETAAFKRKVVA
jgi:hypothetical protein